MNERIKNRDPFFDLVKAIAIFLVLLGHVGGLAVNQIFPVWVDNFRVGMNMPIFFIVSGYFAYRTIETHDLQKLSLGIRSYFQPAFVAGVFFLICELAMALLHPTPSAIVKRMLRFVFVDPWFLTTLAECYVVVFVAMAVGRKLKWGLCLILIVWMLVVCRPTGFPGTISFGCFVSMLPHYLFGAVVLRGLNARIWENWKSGAACLATFVAFVLLEGNVATNGMSFYTADSTIRAFTTVNGGVAFLLRPIMGILGSLGVMWFVRLLLSFCPRMECLAKIGTLTLGVYIFHLWPLERMRGIAWIVSSRWSVVVTAFAMLVFFSILTWLCMEKTGRFKKWIWGR